MFFRVDLVFSYWILFWYILYVLGYTKYNPKLAIVVGIIENFIMLLLMFYFKTQFKSIIHFIIINIFIKIIPYYSIRNTVFSFMDIMATVSIFIIYVIWLIINERDIIDLHRQIFISLVENKNQTPMMWLFNKIELYFINYKPIAF